QTSKKTAENLVKNGAKELAWELSDDARVALHRLGVAESQLEDFVEHKSVAFDLPGGTPGIVTLAQLTPEGRLRVGIYTIKNTDGALGDFMAFQARAEAAARALGAKELEVLGIELTNPKLEAVLKRGGFTPTTMPAPEDLGGGTFNAISRIDP